MSTKQAKPRLSKGILEMKFMQRTKAKVDKEIEEAEGRAMYSNEITDKMMLNKNSNFILEPSFIHCEGLIEGRWSFRGMNPEIERLLELEQAEREAAQRHEQPTEVSDKDMAAYYHAQQAPTATKTMQKKFQNKNKRKINHNSNNSNNSNNKNNSNNSNNKNNSQSAPGGAPNGSGGGQNNNNNNSKRAKFLKPSED